MEKINDLTQRLLLNNMDRSVAKSLNIEMRRKGLLDNGDKIEISMKEFSSVYTLDSDLLFPINYNNLNECVLKSIIKINRENYTNNLNAVLWVNNLCVVSSSSNEESICISNSTYKNNLEYKWSIDEYNKSVGNILKYLTTNNISYEYRYMWFGQESETDSEKEYRKNNPYLFFISKKIDEELKNSRIEISKNIDLLTDTKVNFIEIEDNLHFLIKVRRNRNPIIYLKEDEVVLTVHR
jgi:hypothetical protein